jgi:prepilin-type N-terminal cleavage/methylation domain-containing protein
MTKRNPNDEVRTVPGGISAFSLIELLVVIAVIALLAAMIVPITGKVSQMRIRNRALGQMQTLITGISSYKATYGFYPPDNPGFPTTNQLYFELLGTIFDPAKNTFTTKDGSAQLSVANFNTFFGGRVTGFMNCTKGAASDEGQPAKPFLNNIKSAAIAQLQPVAGSDKMFVFAAKPDWPSDPNFPIAGNATVNPWRYVSSSPAHNRESYDLWIDVIISGKTNRICNWSKQVLINPYP